ncbi:NAD-P-binding protein [Ceratobasidium sp. AG-I]|nr:NAD-P-binding protein [Ceratobasidium sp. AG-I]
MSTNQFTKVVAVAGASGFVGVEVVKALLELGGFEVRIFVRSSAVGSPKSKDFESRGASLHVVSYDDEQSLVDALNGVDVLISAVPAEGLVTIQTQLIKASKVAGVQLFLPSEYGGYFDDIPNHPSPLLEDKKVARKVAAEVGVPVLVFRTGAFPEYNFVPSLGWKPDEGKVTLWGDGNTINSWTTMRSAAVWLANVFKLHPITSLQNTDLKIEGAAVSHNDVVKIWEQKHSAKLNVEYRPAEELNSRIEKDPNDFIAILLDEWVSGHGKFKGPLDNGLYPDWKPEAIESVL